MFEQSFAITATAIRITLAYGHISLASSGIGYLFVGPTNTQGLDRVIKQSFATTTAAIRITLAHGHISLANSCIGCGRTTAGAAGENDEKSNKKTKF